MSRKQSMRVDATDIALIRELEINARQTDYDLARAVAISPSTAHRRIRRLQNARLLRISTISDATTLRYGTQAVIGINVLGGDVGVVADRLVACQNVKTVAIVAGGPDIIIWAVFQGIEDSIDFIGDQLGSIPGVADAEPMMIMRTVKTNFALLAHDQQRPQGNSNIRYPDLDALDLMMIRELENDPRQAITQLARKMGTSRNTAQKRLRKLVDEDIVRITTIADPLILDYTMRGAILIKSHPRRIKAIAKTLATYKRVQSVLITAGRHNVFAWAIYKDQEDMASFRSELSNISGIISHEMLTNLRQAKTSFTLLSGDGDGSEDASG